MDEKQQLLASLTEEFHRWGQLLANLSEEQIVAPNFRFNRTVKDIVAHLTAWQALSIARLQAALLEREPEFHRWPQSLDPESKTDLERINDWIYDTYLDHSWANVFRDWKEGYLLFLELAEAVPEKDLFITGRYSWLGNYPLSEVLIGSFQHHQEHFEPVQEWFLKYTD